MASPPTCNNSAGMLSTIAEFPIFSALTAVSASPRRMGYALQRVSVDNQVLLGLHQSHSYKGLSSTLSICSSVRHFLDLSCMVVDLPCYPVSLLSSPQLGGMISYC